MMSNEFLVDVSSLGVQLAPTAGEAHWQLGMVERMIRTVWSAAERVMKETGVDIHEAVSLAVKSQNQVKRVKGYSPALHDDRSDTVNLAREGTEAFAKRTDIQAKARAIAEEELLNDRLLRAQRARHSIDKVFCSGETVFAWRYGMEKNKGQKRGSGLNKGAWYGRSVVLGTETVITSEQSVPSSIVWVVVNGRLWRCAPQQLRRASERELAEETLMQRRPWTFENIVKEIHFHEYHDLTEEENPPEDPNAAESEQEDMDDDTAPWPPPPVLPKRRRITGDPNRFTDANFVGAAMHARKAMEFINTAFFTKEETPDKVWEVALPYLDVEHKMRRYLRQPDSFVVTSLRKKRVEINERKLNDVEKELVRLSKGKEVQEYIKEEVVRRILANENATPEEAMRMRFFLTWKKDPEGPSGKKAKARLVVLGFQDPHLGKENTCSPTLNRRSKQMLLQIVVQHGWQLK